MYFHHCFDIDIFFLRDFSPVFNKFKDEICLVEWDIEQNYPNNCIIICLMPNNDIMKKNIEYILLHKKSAGFQNSQITFDLPLEFTVLPCAWFDPIQTSLQDLKDANSFFEVTDKTYNFDNFFNGSFSYHWHNRYSLPILENSIIYQLNKIIENKLISGGKKKIKITIKKKYKKRLQTKKKKGGLSKYWGGNNNKKFKLIMNLEYGLGNRFFQIMAGYGFAEKWNMELYFKILSKNHKADGESLDDLKKLFPNLRYIDDSINTSNFIKISESFDTSIITDNTNNDTIMNGLFQRINYFPKKDINISLTEPTNNIIKNINKDNLFFIHFRYGDYELQHPMNNLLNYQKKCINIIKKDFTNALFIVVSDEINKAKDFVKNNLEEISNGIIYDENNNRLDTLYFMSQCRGGICAHSTFSYFGAYCIKNKNGYIYMPEPWVENSSYHTNGNIYPPWCVKISRYNSGG